MRTVSISFSGPTSALPVDVNNVGALLHTTLSGLGTLQWTPQDPYNIVMPPTIWNTISPGAITAPVRAFQVVGASASGLLIINEQGLI